MNWRRAHRAHPAAAALADRHYNRQRVGAPQFVPPGRCVVLLTPDADAVWVTSWPLAAYVKHAWAGAWVNSLFRNESPTPSSALIAEAVAATRWYWPDSPPLGIVTFVDPARVRSANPGYCYKRAGWEHPRDARGKPRRTAGGLVVLQLTPERMPVAAPPLGEQLPLAGIGAER